MREKMKKGLAYLLSSVLFVSTFVTALPQFAITAQAEGSGKAIQLVKNGSASNIEGAQKSNVYFGTYKQTKNGDGFNIDPIKWRVLSNSGEKLFLLSDMNLDVSQYHTVGEDVTWEESTIRSWLNGYNDSQNIQSIDYREDNFIDTAFNSPEISAISEVEVLNEKNPAYNTPWGDNTKDKVYLLSLSEATNTSYGFTYDSHESKNTAYVASGGKTADLNMSREGENDNWWLRTPGSDPISIVVSKYNGILFYPGYASVDDIAVRPAFNLNLKSVLFTSCAEGGKTSGTAGPDALTAVADYSGNDWKVTIEDSSRSGFTAERTDYNVVSAGNTVSIKYSGAQVGTNEFVSAILTDANDNILYYGNIANCTDSTGTATINIKSGTPEGCKLYVFNEQCNGDKKTDYSSKLIDLTAPKTKPVPKNINLVENGEADYIEGAQVSNVYFGTYKQTKNGDGFNIDPIKWRVLSNSDGKLFLLSDTNLDVVQYHTVEEDVTWKESTIRSWLNGYDFYENKQKIDYSADNFIGTAFNSSERSAISEVEVLNEKNPNYNTPSGDNTKDKVYLLSLSEATNTFYGFTDDYKKSATREAKNTALVASGGKMANLNMSNEGENDFWWLRTPGFDSISIVVSDNDGLLLYYGGYAPLEDIAVRPAINLNLKSVLFSSTSEGGKSSDVLDGNALRNVKTLDDASNVVWNFTLRDTSRNNLSISRLGSGEVANGGKVRFTYDNATVGENEYLSAVLVDENGELLSYGKIVKFDSSSEDKGSSYLTLPSNLVDGKTYTLRFISEKCNPSSPTDLSSDFNSSRDITFKVGIGTPSADDFAIFLPAGNSSNPAEIVYDGTDKKVNVSIPEGVTGMGDVKVIYIDQKDGQESEDAPKNAGNYKFKLKISDGTNYKGIELTDDSWKFKINPTDPQVSDFNFKAPDDLKFNGQEKQVNVNKIDEIDGITFKIVYSDNNGNVFAEGKYPVEPGIYNIKVIVSEDGNFKSGTLESTEWKFEIKTVDYKVTLNTNGGKIISNDVKGYTYQIGATLPLASDLEKKGYSFKGWYEDASFTGNPVTEITDKDFGDKTYYAKWEANKYTIIFNANAEGNEQGTMSNQDRIYDDGLELTPNAYTYEGRNFNGWNTNQYGNGTPYSDKDVANLTFYDNTTVILYAQWTIDTFTIVWKNYDGTVLETDNDVPFGSTPSFDAKEKLQRDADAQYTYSFDKWSPEIDTVKGATTYTATYTPILNQYTITFVNEDGTVLQSDKVNFGETPSYNGTPSKEMNGNIEYNFAGWTPSIESVSKDATYTATYSDNEIVYTVSFDANGGTLDTTTALTNSQFKLDSLPTPNRDGYNFKGWYSDKENGKQITSETVFTADTTIYAIWEEVIEDEEDNEEPVVIPDYLDELYLMINIAIELGGERTVYWNKGDSLPFDIMKKLENNPQITLIFEYTYEDVDYRVKLSGKDIIADPKIRWYGPLYLYGVYKGEIIKKEN